MASLADLDQGFIFPGYNLLVYMYHLALVDLREKQGYKSDVSLKRGIQIICTLENDATLYIDTTKPLLIVRLNLLILSL